MHLFDNQDPQSDPLTRCIGYDRQEQACLPVCDRLLESFGHRSRSLP